MLTFHNWQEYNATRSRTAFPGCDWWGPSEWALAMVGEAGEVADAIKKVNRRGPIRDHANLSAAEVDEIQLEIGDTLSYLAQVASSIGVSLESCARAAVQKVNTRKGYYEELNNG